MCVDYPPDLSTINVKSFISTTLNLDRHPILVGPEGAGGTPPPGGGGLSHTPSPAGGGDRFPWKEETRYWADARIPRRTCACGPYSNSCLWPQLVFCDLWQWTFISAAFVMSGISRDPFHVVFLIPSHGTPSVTWAADDPAWWKVLSVGSRGHAPGATGWHSWAWNAFMFRQAKILARRCLWFQLANYETWSYTMRKIFVGIVETNVVISIDGGII